MYQKIKVNAIDRYIITVLYYSEKERTRNELLIDITKWDESHKSYPERIQVEKFMLCAYIYINF